MVERPISVCVLCGLPAAGKSSLASVIVAEVKACGLADCLLLSYDDLIPEDAFQFPSETGSRPETLSLWKLYRHKLLGHLEHFIQNTARNSDMLDPEDGIDAIWKSIIHCLEEQNMISPDRKGVDACQYQINKKEGPLVIILDDNFYYRSMRYEVFQLARKYSLSFCQVFLECPFEVCTQRNSERTCPIPEDTLVIMRQKMEPPDPIKNSWEQNSLILQTHGSILEDIHKVITLLTTAMEHPEKQLEDNTEQLEIDRAICASNILHQSDQTFRKLVSQAMKTAKDNKVPSCTLKQLAEELNKLKIFFLEDLRNRIIQQGQSHVPEKEVAEQITAQFDEEKDIVLQKIMKNYSENPAK
ncbi:L-seryl-tRNA(Sec) kinase [Protopterus annectens]|uniref:L-seryl-tRNA(Sec) kinase n=1 Tax=Protopterus annectens TaxID=7888 RepID=UPI001CFBD441|nr:L-seryl-tRNA(Sec) kinase [Protopterus annectens]